MQAATALFQDVAVAVEENEGFLRSAFGAEALLTVISELHGQVQKNLLCLHKFWSDCFSACIVSRALEPAGCSTSEVQQEALKFRSQSHC